MMETVEPSLDGRQETVNVDKGQRSAVTERLVGN